jgi:hypothetical protein
MTDRSDGRAAWDGCCFKDGLQNLRVENIETIMAEEQQICWRNRSGQSGRSAASVTGEDTEHD